jgi:hypothetical protein
MNLNKKSKRLISVLLILTISIVLFLKLYIYKGHKATIDQIASFDGSSILFLDSVAKSPNKWSGSYVILSGKANNVEGQLLDLYPSIFCQMDTKIEPSIIGQDITIKGRVIGYDDLLEEVKIDQAYIIK